MYVMFLNDMKQDEEKLQAFEKDLIKKCISSTMEDNMIYSKPFSVKKEGKVKTFKAYHNIKFNK